MIIFIYFFPFKLALKKQLMRISNRSAFPIDSSCIFSLNLVKNSCYVWFYLHLEVIFLNEDCIYFICVSVFIFVSRPARESLT